MRLWITFLLLFSVLSMNAQKNRKLSLLASYQPYDLQILSFGADYGSVAEWPKLNFEYRYHTSISGQLFLNQTDTDQDKYYGVINDVHFCTKFFGLGGQFRIIFQDNRQRYEFGPSFKLGYKYVWLNYVWSGYNFGNNPFKHHRYEKPIEFNDGDHNIRLVLSIPLVKIKN